MITPAQERATAEACYRQFIKGHEKTALDAMRRLGAKVAIPRASRGHTLSLLDALLGGHARLEVLEREVARMERYIANLSDLTGASPKQAVWRQLYRAQEEVILGRTKKALAQARKEAQTIAVRGGEHDAGTDRAGMPGAVRAPLQPIPPEAPSADAPH